MSSVVLPYTVPPPGFNYLSTIEACYTFVLISLPLSSMLVPILLLILFFSTPRSRKTLLFALNVLIVLLGITEGVLSTIVQSIVILHPQQPVSDHLFLAYIGIAIYTPIIVDGILILRLSAVYPAALTSRSNRVAILAVPLLCTVARIVCVTLFVRAWAIRGYHSGAIMAGNTIWSQNPMIIADWSIQLFENLYCSILFLCRLRGHKAFSSRMYRQQSIAARVRAVFYIALSNFIFPSILSVFQLTYIIRDRSVVHGATVLMVNNYTSIIGVVFCTIWCSSDVWKGTHSGGPSYGLNTRELDASFRQSMITLSGIAPNLNLSTLEPRRPHPLPHYLRHSISHSRITHPFTSTRRYEDDSKDVVTDSGVNLPRALKGDASDAYPRTLATADADADLSAESHSPITPHDVRVNLDSQMKREQGWDATLPPSSSEPCIRHNGSHFEPEPTTSLSESDMDTELDFATPTPPPSQRRWHSQQLRSRSLSDSSDYRGRGHPRNRDIGEIFVSPTLAEPMHRPGHTVRDDRRLRPLAEDDRHTIPFVNDDRPSVSRANRPSFLDWSDAEHGGRYTPSWDGRSHEEP